MLPPFGHSIYPYSVAEDAKRITLIQVSADAVRQMAVKDEGERSAVLPLPFYPAGGQKGNVPQARGGAIGADQG
ncbi:hypothetical protein RN49_09090 [Pantoea agglomerans]|nr:hypothetical protein RN49_09090 [Pantoea agglomerans]MBA5702832.1 hypothetical protein [Pantoea agglomerans]